MHPNDTPPAMFDAYVKDELIDELMAVQVHIWLGHNPAPTDADIQARLMPYADPELQERMLAGGADHLRGLLRYLDSWGAQVLRERGSNA